MDIIVECNPGSLVQIIKLLNSEFPEMLKRTDVFSLAKVMLHPKDIGPYLEH